MLSLFKNEKILDKKIISRKKFNLPQKENSTIQYSHCFNMFKCQNFEQIIQQLFTLPSQNVIIIESSIHLASFREAFAEQLLTELVLNYFKYSEEDAIEHHILDAQYVRNTSK